MPCISHPYIVDVEASGFGPGSYPIEVGLALQPHFRYCALIKPDPSWTHWDDSAEEVHGITRSVLMEKGKPLVEVAQELNRLLKEKIVFSDGWVVDEPWLIRLYETANMQREFSIYDIQTIMTELQMDNWREIKQQVVEELNLTRHRASNDARIIQETYKRSLLISD